MTVNWNEPIEAAYDDGRIVAAELVSRYDDRGLDVKVEGRIWFVHNDGTCAGPAFDIRNVVTATLTGGSSPYYSIDVNGVTIECNDLIKALHLPYADGNVLKAVWRIAIDRMGRGKPGTTRLYDAEKIVFFGNDMVEREKADA